MEMSKKKLIAIAAAATVGIGALSYGAVSWARGDNNMGDRLVNRATKVLSLDEGQVASLKLLQTEIVETRQLMHSDGFMANFSEILNEESFDQQRALNSINERVTTLQSNAPELVSAAAVFVDGLSPEQKATLIGKMEKIQKHRGHGRGKH